MRCERCDRSGAYRKFGLCSRCRVGVRPPSPYGTKAKHPEIAFAKFTIPEPNSGCLLWIGAVKKGGKGMLPYGRLKTNGRHVKAHRYAWERARGLIPDGLLVLHTCDNPCCVNALHLYLGTHKDNALDCSRRGRRRPRKALVKG